ncbi:MAG: hypothetical protein ACYC2H_05685 [Thermoplasmatota archaeon]
MRFAPFVMTVLCAALLSGCANNASNDGAGQSVAQDGNLAFNGTGSGSHSSKFDCDGSGSVSFGANLGSGSVTVTVKDSTGKSLYSKTANGVGQTGETKDVEGAAGEWTISATRASGFTGQYGVDVSCD